MDDKTVPGLNELTPVEYFEDYKLYLEHCDMPDQRNLPTYFAEFEHQEGAIHWVTKSQTAMLVSRWLMEPLEAELIKMVSTVYDWVLQNVQHQGEYIDPKNKPTQHEGLVEYVKQYQDALKRGIALYL